MDRSHDNVSVVLSGLVDIVKSASIWQAIMIEKRGIGIYTVGPDPSIPTVKRFHQPKGIGFVLGKECSSELKGECSRGRRKYRGEQ